MQRVRHWPACDIAIRAKGLVGALLLVLQVLVGASAAAASTGAPGWAVSAFAAPTEWHAEDSQDSIQEITVRAAGGTFALGAVARGVGNIISGSPVITDTEAVIGQFVVGAEVNGEQIPAGTVITGVHDGAINLSKPATGTRSRKAEEYSFTVGRPQTTGPIACNAPASLVQSELEALPIIGAGNVRVTGGAATCSTANTSPYVITFIGALAGRSIVAETKIANTITLSGGLAVDSGDLVGGAKEATVSYTQAGAAHDQYRVTVENVGAVSSTGLVTIRERLPLGMTAVAVEAFESRDINAFNSRLSCGLAGSYVECSTSEPVAPLGLLEVVVNVNPNDVRDGQVSASVVAEGGGAHFTTTTETKPNSVGGAGEQHAQFGLALFDFDIADVMGMNDLAAGGHPYSLTATFGLNTELRPAENYFQERVAAAKDIVVTLPGGFVGNPMATRERCTIIELQIERCPPGSAVGYVTIWGNASAIRSDYASSRAHIAKEVTDMFNMVPEDGYPATLAVVDEGFPVNLYPKLIRIGGQYRLQVTVPGLTTAVGIKLVSVTLFGDPAAENGVGGPHTAFLGNPASCTEGTGKVRMDTNSWMEPERWVSAEQAVYPHLTGCDLLHWTPSFAMAPSEPDMSEPSEGGTTRVDQPSSYTADLKSPQSGLLFGETATAQLRDAVVTLPEGVSVSPSAANGVVGCDAEGPGGINIGSSNTTALGQDLGDPEATELGEGHAGGNGSPYDDGLWHTAPGHCPNASTLGTVEVTTPLLSRTLRGHVYLASPKCGGEGQPACSEADATNGNLYGLYIEVAGEGVIVKLPGTVSANPVTGQLTATFRDNPQLPFSELRLHFFGGPGAALANPQACGTYATNSSLTPWSAPQTPTVVSTSTFEVTGCERPSSPFAPSFQAGTVSNGAGAYSPLTVSFWRHDGEQDLASVQVKTPQGLLGKIAGIPRCAEEQANLGSCSTASQIGTTTVAAGPGSKPLWITGGRVYLTQGYKGAPFGLSIVVPAKAGPFNLGNVVVRAAITVDPNTAELTVTADPLPQILDGVPFRLRVVNVDINRENFIFNATDCNQQQITATIGSAQQAVARVASPYAPNGCANLPFRPSFSASTAGKASANGNGASLNVKVSYGSGEANIRSVDVQLPKLLPARLTTLQRACTAAQFDSNPAGCPISSDVGTATGRTPVLDSPLTGPAYLVSHGNTAFPDLEVVLQGEGIQVILDGKTDIKHGITYSRFESLPDAPISQFELKLPANPHSALASPAGSLCGKRLIMPTVITGQNGRILKQSTRIVVTGCPHTKKVTKRNGLRAALRRCRRKPRQAARVCEARIRRLYASRARARRVRARQMTRGR